MCLEIAVTYTWWGPFGTKRPEAVIREAMTTKRMRTGSTVNGRHYTRGESEMFGLVINVMRLLGNSNMNLYRASAFFLFSRFHYSL